MTITMFFNRLVGFATLLPNQKRAVGSVGTERKHLVLWEGTTLLARFRESFRLGLHLALILRG